MRFVLKPSYSWRIMKVSNKENMTFDEISKESFFASAVVYFTSGISSNPAQEPSEYTTADAKNDSFGNSSNLLISLLETFIILEEYEGLSTKRKPDEPECVLCSNRILRGL